MRAPDLELLWWEGCPSTERALTELREAISDVGLDQAEIRTREIETDDEASQAGFRGSPTILIDGVDIAGASPDEHVGLGCRVYRRRDGRISPTPDPEDLRDALRRAAREREGAHEMTIAIGDDAPKFELPDTDGTTWSSADGGGADRRRVHLQPLPVRAGLARPHRRRRARLLRPRRALPGDQLQRRRRATRATPTRRCSSAWPPRTGRCPTCTTRPRTWPAPTAPRPRPTCSCSTARAAWLPRRARRRLRGPEPAGGVAARRARRRARRRAARHGRDQARRLLDQVEAVGGRLVRRLGARRRSGHVAVDGLQR